MTQPATPQTLTDDSSDRGNSRRPPNGTAAPRHGRPSGVWSMPLPWLEKLALLTDAGRDVGSVKLSGDGANHTRRMRLCWSEYLASITHERLVATDDVARMVSRMRELSPKLRRAEEIKATTGRTAELEVTPPGALPGEETMPAALVDLRRQWDRNTRIVDAERHHAHAAAVLAEFQARFDVEVEQILARVRRAQASGLAAYHRAARKIDYYAVHLIRKHPEGAVLNEIDWPYPLDKPVSWLVNEAEAVRMICGPAWWTNHTSDGELS